MSSPRAKQLLPAGHVCSVNQKKAYPSKFWVTQRYLPLNSIQIYFFKYKKARTNSERVLCVGTDAMHLVAASERLNAGHLQILNSQNFNLMSVPLYARYSE